MLGNIVGEARFECDTVLTKTQVGFDEGNSISLEVIASPLGQGVVQTLAERLLFAHEFRVVEPCNEHATHLENGIWVVSFELQGGPEISQPVGGMLQRRRPRCSDSRGGTDDGQKDRGKEFAREHR